MDLLIRFRHRGVRELSGDLAALKRACVSVPQSQVSTNISPYLYNRYIYCSQTRVHKLKYNRLVCHLLIHRALLPDDKTKQLQNFK